MLGERQHSNVPMLLLGNILTCANHLSTNDVDIAIADAFTIRPSQKNAVCSRHMDLRMPATQLKGHNEQI